MQSVAPVTLEYLPTWQSSHDKALMAPLTVENLPGGHAVQTLPPMMVE